jgi:hypothetical protein
MPHCYFPKGQGCTPAWQLCQLFLVAVPFSATGFYLNKILVITSWCLLLRGFGLTHISNNTAKFIILKVLDFGIVTSICFCLYTHIKIVE